MTQLVVIGLVLLATFGMRRLLRNTRIAGYRPLQQSLIALGVILFLLLALTGRLGLLVPVLGAVLAALLATFTRLLPLLIPLLLQYLPLWRRHRQQGAPADKPGGGISTVESPFLRMHLHHDSGQLSGDILAGDYAGQSLDALDLAQLTRLYQTYTQRDPESARLLAAYIERVHGNDWQTTGPRGQRADAAPPSLDRTEAFEILGLKPGASRADIVATHRRLIQKLHPDRGGSDYLAAKINQAKDLLLGD